MRTVNLTDLGVLVLTPIAGGWLGWLLSHSFEVSISLAIIFAGSALLCDEILPAFVRAWYEIKEEEKS